MVRLRVELEDEVEQSRGNALRLESIAPAMKKKGRVHIGCDADLVLFDPESIIDRATFDDPHQYPDGIQTVIVNGSVVMNEGESTGELSGRILKKRMS